jgi:hypothetical protein
MINEKINELKKCYKTKETKDLFINGYKTSPIMIGQMLFKGLVEVKSQTIPKI